jgi:NTE family protein
MKIKTAVRISISIPMYFTAVLLNDSGEVVRKPTASENYQVFVDGGILANYPLHIFDTIPPYEAVAVTETRSLPNKTLGFKVERPEQIEYYKTNANIAPFTIRTFRQYINALYNVVIESLNRNDSHDAQESKTIFISTDNISARVRKISMQEKQMLFQNGQDAVTRFLESGK